MSFTSVPKGKIQVFDSAINPLGQVDTYESLTFGRGARGPEPFTIVLNWNLVDKTGTVRWATLFARGNLIMIDNDSTKVGIITKVAKAEGPAGKQDQKVTISGYELAYIFTWRKCDPQAGNDNYVLSGPAETVMKTMVSDQAGPTATNVNRNFPLLTIATNQARGSTYLLSSQRKTVLEELSSIALASSLGFRLSLDIVNKKYIFDVFPGSVKTVGNNPEVVFSSDYNSLKSSIITEDDTNYRNLVTVAGMGQGSARTVLDIFDGTQPEPAGISRRETFLNASDVSSNADITSKGTQTLIQMAFQKTLEGSPLAFSPFIYQQNYDIGDYVTIISYGLSQNSQVTAGRETWQAGSYELDVTFDKAPAQFPSVVAKSVANLQSQVASLGASGLPASTVTSTTVYPQITKDVRILINAAGATNHTISTNGANVVGARVTFTNVGTGVATIIADTSGINATLKQGQGAEYIWDGLVWRSVSNTPMVTTGTFTASGARAAGGGYELEQYPNGKMVINGWAVITGSVAADLIMSLPFPVAFVAINNMIWGTARGRNDSVVPSSLTDTNTPYSVAFASGGASASAPTVHVLSIDASSFAAADRIIVTFYAEGTWK